MKYLLIFSMAFITGCVSVGIRGEYRGYQDDFYEIVSNPIKEKNRKELETKFKELKIKISKGNYTNREKEKFIRDVDYYLMVLDDLKD
ncbi:MAG: hypothetical protein ACRCYT_04855 [Cetobacterium sp.]